MLNLPLQTQADPLGRQHPQEAPATLVLGPSQEPTHNSMDLCLKTLD